MVQNHKKIFNNLSKPVIDTSRIRLDYLIGLNRLCFRLNLPVRNVIIDPQEKSLIR